MNAKRISGTDILRSAEINPQNDSWARITTRSTLVGAAILVGLLVLLAAAVDMRSNGNALAFLGVLGVLIFMGFVLGRTPMRRRVVPGNAGLTFRIKSDLITELGAGDVNVDSSHGVVTLRGSVPFPDIREQAEQIARRGGAKRVVNSLTVVARHEAAKPDSYFSGMPAVSTPEGAPEVATRVPLEQLVREALEADERVNAYLVIISVVNGSAYLSGRQDTTEACAAATEITLRVPGIFGVSNEIEIEASV